jgi:epoxyqueuosine reductase
MITKEQIREYITQLGVCSVGFTHPGPFERLEKVLDERRSSGYLSGFEKGSLQERCCPCVHYDWVRSIIAVAYPYALYQNMQTMGLNGTISGSATGEDYHRLLKSKLEQSAGYISERVEGFRYAIMVDTGPLADREVACRSGIGWYGKNCSIITPSSGSGVFLGEMLTNLELEPDSPLEGDCGRCTRCIENCPTGALVKPYTLDARKCISFLTQKRGVIPREIRGKMGTSVYGCDRCLLSCPHNSSSSLCKGEENSVGLEELVNMDRTEFDRRYRHSALGWRGLNLLKRNAVIALGNLGDKKGLGALKTALEHPSPTIRGHAAWAVGQIDGERAREMLTESLDCEKNEYVLKEVKAALEGLAQS